MHSLQISMSMGCLINDGMNILKVGMKEKSEEEEDDEEEEEENFHFRQALGESLKEDPKIISIW